MGYFNYFIKCVIRKIVNFIFNKKNFFKFCCILFLVLVITKLFLQTPISYGATTTISDTTYYDGYIANRDGLDDVQKDLCIRIKNSNSQYKEMLMECLNSGDYTLLTYYGSRLGTDNVNSLPVNKSGLHVIFLPTGYIERTTSFINWNNNGEVTCSTSWSPSKDFPRFYFIEKDLYYVGSGNNGTDSSKKYIYPSYLLNYRSDFLTSFVFDYFGVGDAQIANIIQESTNTIIESNQQVQNSVDEQTNTIKQQQEFLTNNTISDDSIALPKDTTNDTTGVDDEINFIFDDIMNVFTDISSNNFITLTFPFTNQTFNISYASVYNGAFEKNNSMAYLKRIIQLGYWYIVAVFVIKDISYKVNKIKTGDIDKIQTGNIKEDLL